MTRHPPPRRMPAVTVNFKWLRVRLRAWPVVSRAIPAPAPYGGDADAGDVKLEGGAPRHQPSPPYTRLPDTAACGDRPNGEANGAAWPSGNSGGGRTKIHSFNF